MHERIMIDTEELMVTIYSMMIYSYSLLFFWKKNMGELIKIHNNRK